MRHASLAFVTLQLMSFGCEQRVPVDAVGPSPAAEAAAHATIAASPDAAPNDPDAFPPTSRAIPGVPDLVGPADEDAVRTEMRVDGRERFGSCYDTALQSAPDLHGRVVFSFTIQPDGSVASPAVRESSLNHAEAEACMIERLGGMRFPAVAQPVDVTFPFSFEIDEHTH